MEFDLRRVESKAQETPNIEQACVGFKSDPRWIPEQQRAVNWFDDVTCALHHAVDGGFGSWSGDSGCAGVEHTLAALPR